MTTLIVGLALWWVVVVVVVVRSNRRRRQQLREAFARVEAARARYEAELRKFDVPIGSVAPPGATVVRLVHRQNGRHD